MKNLLNPLILFVLLVFAFSFSLSAQTKTASATVSNKVEVLDFHTEHRCFTCIEIEKQTRKVLDDFYGKEQKSGKVTFRLINVDDKANAAIVQKFLAFGTTLIVYSVSNGKENKVDLTNFAFMNFNKADKFSARLREEVNAALKNLNL